MKQSNIVYKVAQDTGIPRQIVQEVENTLWNGIRYYLTHPLEARLGIRLNYFGVFEIKLHRMKSYVDIRRKKAEDKDKVFEPYETLIKRLEDYGKK